MNKLNILMQAFFIKNLLTLMENLFLGDVYVPIDVNPYEITFKKDLLKIKFLSLIKR